MRCRPVMSLVLSTPSSVNSLDRSRDPVNESPKACEAGVSRSRAQVIATEERQEIELLAVDPHLDRRRRRFDDGHVGGDDEAFAQAADGKLDVDDGLGAEQQDQPVADDGSEARSGLRSANSVPAGGR